MPPQLTKALIECIGAYIEERYVADEIEYCCNEQEDPNSPFDAGAHVIHAPGPLPAGGGAAFAAPIPALHAPTSERPRERMRAFGASRNTFTQIDSIDDLLKQREATFSEALLNEIDARQLTDPEVYKRANIDRKLFSKIRGNTHYQPKKPTAIALALALGMNLDDTLDFIGRAGYTLTASSKADLIVMYFIEHECWDIDLINQALYEFDQPIIGR